MPAGMAALSHGMAKCIYTRGCTGVRPAFAAIVFVSQLFDIIKAVQLLLWQAIAFSFPAHPPCLVVQTRLNRVLPTLSRYTDFWSRL